MQKFKATMYVRLSHSDENTEKESNSIVNQKKLYRRLCKKTK